MILDRYISYTTNLTQRKYKHKRDTLDLSYKTKLYDSIRTNGGWTNWKCIILEECSCTNDFEAKKRVNFYIMKLKPNLNDEKFDEKSIDEFPNFSDFKPNIFGPTPVVTTTTPVFHTEIFGGAANKTKPASLPTTKDGKYICLCKKSYAHRSSYYKHTSTCLQFQHNQSVNKLVNSNSHHSSESALNSLSVSFISTTTTLTTTRTTMIPLEIEQPISREIADINNDDDNRLICYRFKSKKKTEEINGNIFNDSSSELLPEPEISVHVSEYSGADSDSDSDVLSYASSSEQSVNHDHNDDDMDIDDETAITGISDTASSAVSDFLTEQNEKLKEYIRKMISALTDGKKRNKTSIVNSLVFELLDQNKTLQKQIIELSKERNIIVNNTNNNQFNLNFFLNEQCKDAVNLSDFVNSLEITMDDLTYTRNQGLVEGISKVMIDGLKQMDLYKRPIHCTDQKRDTIYVRDNHQWARDEGNARIRQAFVDIANKEYFAIKKWMDLHPGWETNSQLQDFHHKMVKNVLHEIKDDPIGERKIMKSVEREVFIEK